VFNKVFNETFNEAFRIRASSLTRHFSFLAFVLVVVAGVALGVLVRQQEIGQLERLVEERNVAMTKVFRNVLADDIGALLDDPQLANASESGQTPRQTRLDSKIAALMHDSEVAKLKLYNLRGVTVFSTDRTQIGAEQSDNAGFIVARDGQVATELVHRDEFSAFDGDVLNVDLVSSYVPIVDGGRVVAVFEVYQNVSASLRHIDNALWQLTAIVVLVLGALYLLLLLVVRHAQHALRAQKELLQTANRELDRRVAERTTDLQRSETRLSATLDSARDAFITLDIVGNIVGWNPAAETMFGYPSSEVLGQSVAKIVAPLYLPLAMKSFHIIAQENPAEKHIPLAELGGQRKDGSEFVIDGFVSSWATAEGRFFTAIVSDIGQRNEKDKQIRELLQEQRAIFDNAHAGILLLRNRRILKCNQRIASMFGFANPQELQGKSTEIFYPSTEGFEAAGEKAYAILVENGFVDLEIEMRRRDGRPIWVIQSGRPLNPGAVLDSPSIWVYTDITERKQVEAELRIAATAFESLESIVVTDANAAILRTNQAFSESTGYSAEELVGQNPRILRSDRHDSHYYAAMWESIRCTGCWQGEIWDRRKNGEVYPKWLAISAVKNLEGVVTHYVGTHTDITARKLSEDKIKQLAFFDQLSGLPNRTLLLDRLQQSMATGERSRMYGALLFLDLDHFKSLNDTLGHDHGDLLLQAVAQRLMANVRQGDTVARLGGDEFVILLNSLAETPVEAARLIEIICRKILEVIGQDYLLPRSTVVSSASIGATLFLGQQANAEDLLKQADMAMYQSKAAGRSAYTFFDPAMETAMLERAQMESDLRRALKEEQFVLYYQAQVDGESARVVGVEALIRWNHPTRGRVSPDAFIPRAEESGLIVPLGLWVLKTACAQLAIWAGQAQMAHLTLAVNVSVQQFQQADFVQQVLAVLDQTGANPQKLKLELTESLFVDNVEDIIAKMMTLRAKGIGFSLDDFGTGYSSLAYLSRLPLDQLKIDRSFVMNIENSDTNAVICAATIGLAHSLKLKVVAEGVETAAQRYFLTTVHRCGLLQGYLFSRPLPLVEFEALLLS
jgi:diguanylate cyclase (GGDEF)-like protein/PAS domain S-box-containing protein